MKKKVLYIFLSPSNKPDLYVNIISYWIARHNYSEFEKIEVIRIADDPIKKEDVLKSVQITRDNIAFQLRVLTTDKYCPWDLSANTLSSNFQESKVENFERVYRDAFLLFQNESVKGSVILADDIEEHLERLVRDKSHKYIFDLTGLRNRELIKVCLFLFSEKHDAYSMEIIKPMKHNDLDLLHKLSNTDFQYKPFEAPRGVSVSKSER